MCVDEREYYRFSTEKPGPPAAGFLMLERRPQSNVIKVTWSDGQSLHIVSGPLIHLQFKQWGIPRERMERALSYIWNFGVGLVTIDKGFPDVPPTQLPHHPKRSIG